MSYMNNNAVAEKIANYIKIHINEDLSIHYKGEILGNIWRNLDKFQLEIDFPNFI